MNQQKIIDNYKRQISDWASQFELKHGRAPMESELIDNLQDKMNPELLKQYVKEFLDSNVYDQDEMV